MRSFSCLLPYIRGISTVAGFSILLGSSVLAETYSIIDALPETPSLYTDSQGNQFNCTPKYIEAVERNANNIAALVRASCLGVGQTGSGQDTILSYLNGALRLINPATDVPAGFRLSASINKILLSGVSAGEATGPFDSSSSSARITGLFSDNPRYSTQEFFPIEIGKYSNAYAIAENGAIFGRSPHIMNGPTAEVLTAPFIKLPGHAPMILPDFFPTDTRGAHAEISAVTINPSGQYELIAWNGRTHAARVKLNRRTNVVSNTSLFAFPEMNNVLFPWTRALDPITLDIHMTLDNYVVPGYSVDREAIVVDSNGNVTHLTDDVASYPAIAARACHAAGANAGTSVFFCYDGYDSENQCIAQSAGIRHAGEIQITALQDITMNLASFAVERITNATAMSQSGDLISTGSLVAEGSYPGNDCNIAKLILRRN